MSNSKRRGLQGVLGRRVAPGFVVMALYACSPAHDGGWLEGGSEDETGDETLFCESQQLGPPLLRRLTRVELHDSLIAVFPELGASWDGLALGPDPISERGFSNDAGLLVVGEQTAAEILAIAESVAIALTSEPTLLEILPCAASDADWACANTLVHTRGRALYRRDLSEEEREAYAALFGEIAESADFAIALRWTLVALIQSPNFVYRFELGDLGVDTAERDLQDWEIATSLAYTYSGVGPDAELLEQAATGALMDPQTRIEVARDLLGSAQGEAIVGRFFAEWIRYTRASSKVKTQAPEFEVVRVDLVEETRRFIDEVVRVQDGTMGDLLTTPTTQLNSALSQYYGWGEVGAAGFESRPRPEAWSVGLLAQGSVLSGYAHTDSSSPTQRGLLLHEKLLCRPGLTPPPDIPNIDPPAPGVVTTRERYELAHAGDAACAACHDFFDPLGFAFEHFDESGRYRPDESGLTIDASGSVALGSGETINFDGLTQLAQGLADSVQVHACAGDNLERFAFGFEVEGCRSLALRQALADQALGLEQYFVELAGTPAFGRREVGP